jgi:intracellular sulfur oxidation DsrE/DsrF family protein
MTASRLSRVVFVGAAVALAGLLAAAQAEAQAPVKQAAQAKPAKSAPAATHKVAIQVNQNDKAVMDLALNNAKNVIDYYKAKGETVAVEIVTFGPGLHMLRADTSPVKERIAPMSLENPNLAFIACGNTQANQSKAEGKPVSLIGEAKVVPSGVVRLMELQKQGYAYIRP